MYDVNEICSAKVIIGNESIYVIGIYRTLGKVKWPQFDEIQIDLLNRFGLNDFVILVDDFHLDTFSSE